MLCMPGSVRIAEPVQTFTMGFGGTRNPLIDERPLARNVAARFGCNFHEGTAQPDFRGIVGDIAEAFDEPFADDSIIPSYYVSQFTRQNVKVAMSGLGGDELFAGYERYSGMLLSQYYQRLVPGPVHRQVIRPLINCLPEPTHGGDRVDHAKRFADGVLQPSAKRYLGFVLTLPPSERKSLFAQQTLRYIDFEATGRLVTDPFEQCGGADDLTRALYADIKTYLPEDILALSDRLSMWHSLEVRVPLVDHKLVELSARLPTRFKADWHRKKILLKQIASRRLPPEVISHRKQGFEAPMAAWLRTDLTDYAHDILGPKRLGASGLFNLNYVSARLEEHLGGRRKHNKLLFSLIMFQEWLENLRFEHSIALHLSIRHTFVYMGYSIESDGEVEDSLGLSYLVAPARPAKTA